MQQWSKNHMKLQICPRGKDTCTNCWQLMEDLTHKSTKKNTGTKQASQGTLPESELEVLVSDYGDCMTRCSSHIKMYKAQYELSDVCISQAKADFNNDTPLASRTVCLIMDMMQN